MTDTSSPLGIVRDFDDLLGILRARRESLDISFSTLDAISGLQDGYAAKILGPSPSRYLGRISLGALIGALGMQLVAVEDSAAMARLARRLVKRRRYDTARHWRNRESVSA